MATALLHSAIVVEKRNALKSWTVLLAILSFSFSLIGTFIVRSGVITSVHAFANDPERGVFILVILAVAIGGALTLYAFRANQLKSTAVFGLISRESGLVMNNLLLSVAAAVVFVGTIWPLVAEILTGAKVSVGAPFFNIAFTPFMVVLAMILPIAAMLPWKRSNLSRTMQPLWGIAALSVALGAAVWVMQTGGRMLAPVGLTLAFWVVVGAMADVALRVKLGKASLTESLRRAGNLPRADWGKMFAHIGFGLMIFGISAIMAWEFEDIRTAEIGETFPLQGYEIRFDAVEGIQGPNYTAARGEFTLFKDAVEIAKLYPEKRNYPVQAMPTTEAAIDQTLLRDVYVVLGDRQSDGSWAVRSYVKPFTNWIWIGVFTLSFGGVLSITDRRYRVASAARKTKISAVPAE
jgi:cytochrome c-type biogenesis protein CcmF